MRLVNGAIVEEEQRKKKQSNKQTRIRMQSLQKLTIKSGFWIGHLNIVLVQGSDVEASN